MYSGKNNFVVDEAFIYTPESPMFFNNGFVFFIETKVRESRRSRRGTNNITHDPKLQYWDLNEESLLDDVVLVDCGEVIAAVVYKNTELYRTYNPFNFNYGKRSLGEAVEEIKKECLSTFYLMNFDEKLDDGFTSYCDPYLGFIKRVLTGTSEDCKYAKELLVTSIDMYASYEYYANSEYVNSTRRYTESEILDFAIITLQSKYISDHDNMFHRNALDPFKSELIYSFYLAYLEYTNTGGIIAYPPSKNSVLRIYNKRNKRYKEKGAIAANCTENSVWNGHLVMYDKPYSGA